MPVETERTTEFEAFTIRVGPDLRRVFVARYGLDVGVEVAADALAYAWEHWDRVPEARSRSAFVRHRTRSFVVIHS